MLQIHFEKCVKYFMQNFLPGLCQIIRVWCVQTHLLCAFFHCESLNSAPNGFSLWCAAKRFTLYSSFWVLKCIIQTARYSSKFKIRSKFVVLYLKDWYLSLLLLYATSIRNSTSILWYLLVLVYLSSVSYWTLHQVRKQGWLGVEPRPPWRVKKVKSHTISRGKILPHYCVHLPLSKDLIINIIILLSKKITCTF